MRRRLVLLPTLACLLALAAAAQDMGPPASAAPPPAGDVQGVVASVNGVPLTSADLTYYTRLLVGTDQAVDEATVHFIRRRIAGQILLSQEAERLEVRLGDQEVVEYWEDRYGTTPDFEQASAASGTTLDHQKELARVQVQAEIYLLHRLGLGGRYSHRIPPEPVFARDVDVTPGELKRFFLAHRDELARPPAVVYDVYPCRDEEAGRVVREALLEGLVPEGRRPVRESCPLASLDEYFAGEPGLADFLAQASPGDVSALHVTERGTLVLQLMERRAGEEPDFAQVQEELRRRMRSERIMTARERLVDRLVRGAVYWPADLFEERDPGPGGSDEGPVDDG